MSFFKRVFFVSFVFAILSLCIGSFRAMAEPDKCAICLGYFCDGHDWFNKGVDNNEEGEANLLAGEQHFNCPHVFHEECFYSLVRTDGRLNCPLCGASEIDSILPLVSNRIKQKTILQNLIYWVNIDVVAVYPEAKNAVRRFQNTDDIEVQKVLLSLLSNLVKRGKSYKLAENVAMHLQNTDDSGVQIELLLLLSNLVKKGQSYEHAGNIATHLQNTDDLRVQKELLLLLSNLVKKGQFYGLAEKVADLLQNTKGLEVKTALLLLLRDLVVNEQSYGLAENVAMYLQYTDNLWVQRLILLLLRNLVARGQSYDFAMVILDQLKDSSDELIQEWVATLRKELGK